MSFSLTDQFLHLLVSLLVLGYIWNMDKEPNSQILLYNSADGETKIEVKLENDTVWLAQEQMAELFDKGRSTVTEHISNIFKEGELEEQAVCRFFRRTGSDHKTYEVKLYNLDVIISVDYRVHSHRGTQFRIWATKQLREYLIKGFVMDDKRLADGKTFNGESYFDELLARVRAIRTSEHNLYQKVRDIFATSMRIKMNTRTIIHRVFFSIIAMIGLVGVFFVFFLFRSLDIEDFCADRVRQDLGSQWGFNRAADLSDNEKIIYAKRGVYFPGISQTYFEELKCRSEQKFFFLF
jgi:hypothetical protein